ncbi:hypothetical protein E1B28_008353 [Marasmius oreades]|uniref:Uncharacterized protein n=1 Tax=Marasmius oreades TaxID=181124 RepID=A0A9P7RYD2_9AGAR|nr:uncharacterized protein E1B28_008353 [Marasmius oreades]KAG7091964.1 hypothetical protein E1B28_008353 [Marasmius oreades]
MSVGNARTPIEAPMCDAIPRIQVAMQSLKGVVEKAFAESTDRVDVNIPQRVTCLVGGDVHTHSTPKTYEKERNVPLPVAAQQDVYKCWPWVLRNESQVHMKVVDCAELQATRDATWRRGKRKTGPGSK